jgi:hypothetical protein
MKQAQQISTVAVFAIIAVAIGHTGLQAALNTTHMIENVHAGAMQ